jgi:predicted ester cyclase
MPSTAEDNKAVVLRLLAGVDARRWEVYEELLASDYAYHGPVGALDRAATRESAQRFVAAFPDLRHEIRDVGAWEDKVVARYVNRGTHLGEFDGVAPTGKQIQFGCILIVRISNGVIIESWQEADLASLMSQISG